MPPSQSAPRSRWVATVCDITVTALLLGLGYFYLPCIVIGIGIDRRIHRRPRPRPLPKKRIDIHRKRKAQQPQDCHFCSNLPPEVRELIYIAALGGRWIRMKRRMVEISRGYFESVIQSPGPRSGRPPTGQRNPQSPPLSDSISVALLSTCRQVYVEALPIMHCRNTFHFEAVDFACLFRASLGSYSLPDIRSISIVHVGNYRGDCAAPWVSVFPLVQKMGLQTLEFGFSAAAFEESSYDPFLGTEWVRGILAIKGLHRFRFFVRDMDEVSLSINRCLQRDLGLEPKVAEIEPV
ncbi:hypothetical protein C8J57DRAFT_1236544 [Mycena rebaudengoi]|nr:hypothetical protein C8J57DRAFT_1236544 [Mycena rebaudengoi]